MFFIKTVAENTHLLLKYILVEIWETAENNHLFKHPSSAYQERNFENSTPKEVKKRPCEPASLSYIAMKNPIMNIILQQ